MVYYNIIFMILWNLDPWWYNRSKSLQDISKDKFRIERNIKKRKKNNNFL